MEYAPKSLSVEYAPKSPSVGTSIH